MYLIQKFLNDKVGLPCMWPTHSLDFQASEKVFIFLEWVLFNQTWEGKNEAQSDSQNETPGAQRTKNIQETWDPSTASQEQIDPGSISTHLYSVLIIFFSLWSVYSLGFNRNYFH